MKQQSLVLLILAFILSGCESSQMTAPKSSSTPTNWQADTSYTAQFLIAETAFNREDYESAFDAYGKAADLTNDTSALQYISDRALAYSRFDLASEVITRWLSVQPDSAKAYLAASMVAIHQGNLDNAAQYLDRLFELRQDDSKIEDLNRVARITAESLEADEALDFYYKNVVLRFEEEPDIWLQYAQIAEYHERFDIVEEAISNNLQLDKHNARVALLLYRARTLNGDLPGAEKALTDFLESNSGDTTNPVQNELVRFYFEDDRNLEKALDIAMKLIDKGAYFPRINFTAVIISRKLERPKTTVKLLESLVGKEFGDSELQLSVAELAIEVEQYDLAERQLESMTAPDLQMPVAILRADIIKNTEGEDAQINYLKRVLDEQEELSETLVNSIFYSLTESDRDREALEFIDETIEKHPEATELYYTRGLYLANNGVVDSAIADFERVLEKDADNAAALNALGYTLADNNIQLGRALTLIEKAAELDPDSGYILDSLGWVHFRLGNYEIAENYLVEAYEQNPEGEIKAHLAELYFTIGKTADAKKLLNEAISEFPNNAVVSDTHRRLLD